MSVDISIIIPSKNGEPYIGQLLTAIDSQRSSSSFETIVIDSGSTDNTLSIINRHDVRLYKISPQEFSHSRTRNYGAQMSNAEKYIVFINQDAVPVDNRWLDGLVRSIQYDCSIVASCAMELSDARPFPFNVEGVSSMVFANAAVTGVYVVDKQVFTQFQNIRVRRRRRLVPFTTVCAIFDKTYFCAHSFDPAVEYGEDLHWAFSAIRNGKKVACSSLAQVHHTTYKSERERFERAPLNRQLMVDIFGPEYSTFLERLGVWDYADFALRYMKEICRR